MNMNRGVFTVLVFAALLTAGSARADEITIDYGHIDFAGNFTVTACCGTGFDLFHGVFGPQTAVDATGLFAPFVNPGAPLIMGSPVFNEAGPFLPWTIGGFTIENQFTHATGPHYQTFVGGGFHLTGHGVDYVPGFASDPRFFGVSWGFYAPPFETNQIGQAFKPVTGPITMRLGVEEYVHVPDSGSTVVLLGLSLIGLAGIRRLIPWFEDRYRGTTGYCGRLVMRRDVRWLKNWRRHAQD